MNVTAIVPPVYPSPAQPSQALWRAWHDAGIAAVGQGEYRLAADWLENAVAALPPSAAPSDRGTTLAYLAYAELRRGSPEKAQTAAAQADPLLAQEVGPDAEIAKARTEHVLAAACGKAVDTDICRRHAARALAGYRRHAFGLLDEVDLYLHLADVAEAIGDSSVTAGALDVALERLTHPVSRAEDSDACQSEIACRLPQLIRVHCEQCGPERDRLMAAAMTRRAAALVRLSRLPEAEEQFEHWRDVATRLDGVAAAADTVRHGATVFIKHHLDRGRPDQARRLLDEFARLPCTSRPRSAIDATLTQQSAALELLDGSLSKAVHLLDSLNDVASVDPRIRAAVLLARGKTAFLQGRLAAALAIFDDLIKQAAAERAIHFEARHQRIRVLALLRRLDVAPQEARQLIAETERRQLSVSLDMARALKALCESLQAGNELQLLRPVAEHSLRLYEHASGEHDPDASGLLRMLAECAWKSGRTSDGLRLCDEADRRASNGPIGILERAETAAVRGRLLHARGELAEACCEFWRSIADFSRLTDDRDTVHPLTGFVRLDLATAATTARRTDAATLFSEAESILKALFGRGDFLGFELVRRGHIFRALGHEREALWLYERGVDAYQSAMGPQHPFTRQALEILNRLRSKLPSVTPQAIKPSP